jgi:hypothetical protein
MKHPVKTLRFVSVPLTVQNTLPKRIPVPGLEPAPPPGRGLEFLLCLTQGPCGIKASHMLAPCDLGQVGRTWHRAASDRTGGVNHQNLCLTSPRTLTQVRSLRTSQLSRQAPSWS